MIACFSERQEYTDSMKYGLIMEGGAMRGLFTAGVIDAFMKNGIEFDGAMGVSAGAVFGCNYKSRQPGRALRYNTRFARYPEYGSVRSLLKTGDIFEKQFCYVDVPERLEPFDTRAYTENPAEFWAVATDVDTGMPEYRELETLQGDEMEFMRASASMPVASKVVEIGDRGFLDGGISDPIPLQAMEERGYDRNVVILTQAEDYVKKPQKLMGMMALALKDHPAVTEAMRRRHEVYNQEREYILARQKEGAAYLIFPPYRLPIGRIEHDPNKMREVYDIGYETGMEHLEAVREFMNAK